jgi:soluble lytic murein transglycosylase-like protein
MDGIIRRLWIALYSACLTYFIFTAADAYGAEPIPRIALKYQALLIREARSIWGLDAPTATFAAQIESESGWKPGAHNRRSRAFGLGQFQLATARGLSRLYSDLKPAQPMSPTWSIRALVRYNHHIYRMTRKGSSQCERVRHMLAGYNAGPSRLYKRWPKTTRAYVHRVLRLELVYVANGWGSGSCN